MRRLIVRAVIFIAFKPIAKMAGIALGGAFFARKGTSTLAACVHLDFALFPDGAVLVKTGMRVDKTQSLHQHR